MAKRRVANPLAFAVLGSLIERPMHPYEISTMLRVRGKDQSINLNYGSLYSVVAALEKHGLIEAVETVREGNRPERTIYAVTGPGRSEFDDWLAELLGTPVKEFSQLEAGLAYMAGFAPDRVADLLDRRAVAIIEEVRQLEGVHEALRARQFPRLFWVESEFRLHLLRAELGFVRQLAAEIRADELEGIAVWRRGSELAATLGVSLADLLRDPHKYFGEEFGWLSDIPEGGL